MLNGWVSLDRAILKHWVSQEPELLACWVHLLLEANFEDRKRMFNGSLVEIKRGECVFGLNAFSAKTGISQKKLRRYIDMLESEGMVGRQKTNKYSLISITNYDYYQTQGRQEASKGQAEGKLGASKGQHLNKDNKGNQENNEIFPPPAKPDDPIDPNEIANLYNEILGDLLPSCKAMSKTRKANLRARVKEDAKRRDMAWWRRYFEYIADSPFLTGQIAGKDGKSFRADMGWILLPENLLKIIEGKYNQEG